MDLFKVYRFIMRDIVMNVQCVFVSMFLVLLYYCVGIVSVNFILNFLMHFYGRFIDGMFSINSLYIEIFKKNTNTCLKIQV